MTLTPITDQSLLESLKTTQGNEQDTSLEAVLGDLIDHLQSGHSIYFRKSSSAIAHLRAAKYVFEKTLEYLALNGKTIYAEVSQCTEEMHVGAYPYDYEEYYTTEWDTVLVARVVTSDDVIELSEFYPFEGYDGHSIQFTILPVG